MRQQTKPARGGPGGERDRARLRRARGRRGSRPARQGPTPQELMRERLIESRLTPNAISLTGFALNAAAAALVFERFFFLAGLAFVIGSIMDTLDGRYSRMSGKGTPFGAFLDSTLDRLEEGIVLLAVAAYFAARHNQAAVAAVVAAVLFSLMVSYTRARAEALGVSGRAGFASRPVRVVILSAGLVFAKGASLGHFELLAPAVYVLAGLSVLTTIQRIWHVHSQLRVHGQAGDPRGAIGDPRGAIGDPRGAIGDPRGAVGDPRGARGELRGAPGERAHRERPMDGPHGL